MKKRILPFSPLEPDGELYADFGLTASVTGGFHNGIQRVKRGYRSVRSITKQGTISVTGTWSGAFSCVDDSGTTVKLFATSAAIWQYTGTGVNVSRTTGGAYSCPSNEFWEFCKFGNNVIASNITDAMQIRDLSQTYFAALGGNPPKARHIDVVRDFVVAGNINDGAARPNRVQWCAVNNAASWTVSAATQADYQDLPFEGGEIRKVIGGEVGYIFRDNDIWRMDYVGSPVVFDFKQVSRGTGASKHNAVIRYGNEIYFFGAAGFHKIGAQGIEPIGIGQTDLFAQAQFAGSNTPLSCAVDLVGKAPIWHFKEGTVSWLLRYDTVYKEWGLENSVAHALLTDFYGVSNWADTLVLGSSGTLTGMFARGTDSSGLKSTMFVGPFYLEPDRICTIHQVRPLSNNWNAVEIAIYSKVRELDTFTRTVIAAPSTAAGIDNASKARVTGKIFIIALGTSINADSVAQDSALGVEISYTAEGDR